MSKKRLSILIIPPSTDRVREYSVPQWIVRGCIAVAATIVLGFVSSIGVATYGINKVSEQQDHAEENAELRASLTSISADVRVLREQLARLEAAEKRVRSVFGFPEVNADERALGVGGANVDVIEDLPESIQLSNALESEIDRLLHRAAFERENFESVFSALLDQKQRLDHTPSTYPTNGILMRGFGVKSDPFTGQMRPHRGLDLAAPVGTPVYATASGKVILREFQTHYGNTIVIDHGYGVETLYGHLSKFAIKKGQSVRRGELIGYVGNTGYSTGPHLHYEVHANGRPQNPMDYVYDKAPSGGEPLAQSDELTR